MVGGGGIYTPPPWNRVNEVTANNDTCPLSRAIFAFNGTFSRSLVGDHLPKCTKCKMTFMSQGDLDAHHAEHHVQEIIFSCTFFDLSAKTLANLIDHIYDSHQKCELYNIISKEVGALDLYLNLSGHGINALYFQIYFGSKF